MFRKTVFIFSFLLISSLRLYSEESILKDVKADRSTEYTIRLVNGDIVSGVVQEFVNDQKEGEGIKVRTQVGNAIIFAWQIQEITPSEEHYRHDHSVFLLPTAKGIRKNYFIGVYEGLFIYAGAGITDYFSITLGRSFIPGISSHDQISVINAKASVLRGDFGDVAKSLSVAFGYNLTFLNHNNKLSHIYGVATAELPNTSISAALFYKQGAGDFYVLNFGLNKINMVYEDGSFGIGLGLDHKLAHRNDVHVIGELWNNNIGRPTNTAVLLGIRLCNSSFSSDFGLAFFTQPFVVPFFSFKWTPF